MSTVQRQGYDSLGWFGKMLCSVGSLVVLGIVGGLIYSVTGNPLRYGLNGLPILGMRIGAIGPAGFQLYRAFDCFRSALLGKQSAWFAPVAEPGRFGERAAAAFVGVVFGLGFILIMGAWIIGEGPWLGRWAE